MVVSRREFMVGGKELAERALRAAGWRFWSNESGYHDVWVSDQAEGHTIEVQVKEEAPWGEDVEDQDSSLMGYWLHFGPGDLWNAGEASALPAWLARFSPDMYDGGAR